MSPTLETELATLLTDLLAGQDELLGILTKKGQMLAVADLEGLATMTTEEERLLAVLQGCLERRQHILAQAATEHLPSTSIRDLTASLPRPQRKPLASQVEQAGARARLLQQQGLVNWILVQRTLIHLSQLLEIIATGGRLQPTYGDGQPLRTGGALVDRAA